MIIVRSKNSIHLVFIQNMDNNVLLHTIQMIDIISTTLKLKKNIYRRKILMFLNLCVLYIFSCSSGKWNARSVAYVFTAKDPKSE